MLKNKYERRTRKMIIKKKYERLVNCGTYENIKVGVEIEHNFENFQVTKDDIPKIKKMGTVLGKIAQSVVKDEVTKIKAEIEEEKKNG